MFARVEPFSPNAMILNRSSVLGTAMVQIRCVVVNNREAFSCTIADTASLPLQYASPILTIPFRKSRDLDIFPIFLASVSSRSRDLPVSSRSLHPRFASWHCWLRDFIGCSVLGSSLRFSSWRRTWEDKYWAGPTGRVGQWSTFNDF